MKWFRILTAGCLGLAATVVAGPPTTAPDDTGAWQLLSDGKQVEAEQALAARWRADPKDARALFLIGLLTRSRFEVKEAEAIFRHVQRLAPGTPEADAAEAVVRLDHTWRFGGAGQFKTLEGLADSHPNDPSFVWLIAIECRNFKMNQEGVQAYERLSKFFTVGPVLFHQTYANLLDELDREAESIEHRRMATRLEPEPWSWNGLAGTAFTLKLYDETYDALTHSLDLQQRQSEEIYQLLCSAGQLGSNPQRWIAAARRYVAAYPKSTKAHTTLTCAYERPDANKAADEAKVTYDLNPNAFGVKSWTAYYLRKAGRNVEADAIEKKSDQ